MAEHGGIAPIEQRSGLAADDARDLTDRIKAALDIAWQFIIQAWEGRAWTALGYGSWDDYCTREFGSRHLRLPREERREVVGSLRDAGMSNRAIAAATGLSEPTVRRVAAGAPNGAPEPDDEDVSDAELVPDQAPPPPPPPRPVTGIDGKTYRPPAPRPPQASPPVPARTPMQDYMDEELAKVDALKPTPLPTTEPPQLVAVSVAVAQFKRLDLSGIHPGFRSRAHQAIDALVVELARIKETIR